MEYRSSESITARNIYGSGVDEILARDAGALFYHQDRLGNVSAVSDGLGKVVEQYRYDAYGQPEIRSGPLSGNPYGLLLENTLVNNRFLFTGREWVAQYGFYEYRNRAYNPRLGRFMSEDPLGLQAHGAKPAVGMFPQIAPGEFPSAAFADSEFNLYRYCHNDPVNKSDPMGLEGETDYPLFPAAGLRIVFTGAQPQNQSEADQAHAVQSALMVTGAGPGISGGPILSRFGKSFESATRLAKKSAEAEEKLGIHGVSAAEGTLKGEASTASKAAVEQQFKVHKTGAEPHRTIELPKPVTKQIADLFNKLFGRERK